MDPVQPTHAREHLYEQHLHLVCGNGKKRRERVSSWSYGLKADHGSTSGRHSRVLQMIHRPRREKQRGLQGRQKEEGVSCEFPGQTATDAEALPEYVAQSLPKTRSCSSRSRSLALSEPQTPSDLKDFRIPEPNATTAENEGGDRLRQHPRQ